MATTSSLSIPNNNSDIAIENTNSISDKSIFENAFPLSPEKSKEIKKEKEEIKTIDFFDIINKEKEKIKKEDERIQSLIKDEDIFSSAIAVEEPSTLEKIQYGWAKNDMVAGNILRIAENFWESTFDDDKTFEQAALENAAEEQKEFDEKYWKFKDGKHDGAYSFIGESLTYALDPWYLGGYLLASPALIANPIGTSIVLNAALLGGDNLIEQVAKTGKVQSWESVGWSTAIGGGIGLVLPVGGKLIKNYLPSTLKTKAADIAKNNIVTKFALEKIAKKNNMSVDEVQTLRSIANKEPVKKIEKQIENLLKTDFKFGGKNIAAPLINAKNKYEAVRTNIANELKKVIDLRKTTKKELKIPQATTTLSKRPIGSTPAKIEAIKSYSKKILDLRIQGNLAKKAYEKEKQRLLERQVKKINKYYDLEGQRTAQILAELKGNFNLGERFLNSVLANIAKPIFGALGGGAANVGASIMGFDVEDDIYYWMLAGAAFGYSMKAVGNSLYKMPLQQRDAYGKIIQNTATRFTLQKIRELTAGTLATKLNAFGGTTQKIGKLLLRQIDDPMSKKSVIADADKLERYLLEKANRLLMNTTPEERLAAISINRGNNEIKNSANQKVLDLASALKGFTDEITLLANQAGFKSPQKIDDYFPRLLNRQEINKDFDKAVVVFTDIFKKNYNLDDKKAKAAALTYLNAGQELQGGIINKTVWDKIISGTEAGQAKHFAKGDSLVTTPVSNHIVQKRSLNGPYELVEKVLEKNNYLVNDLTEILPRMVTDSVKSIAFARKFGVNGELLKPLLLEIKNKYDLLPKERLAKWGYKEFTKQSEAKHEAGLVLDAIDAYFGKYTGVGHAGQLQSSVGILTMLSNLNMLGRVTIASLGDIVQIFQHSSNFSAAVKGMLTTNIRSNWEKGLAREMNLHFTNEMTRSASRTAAMQEGQMLIGNKWIGRWGVKDIANPQLYNNLAFKGLGLEWLTGYARRFAYNAGTFDAYTLARKYYKIATGPKGANNKKAIELKNKIYQLYGVKPNEALQLGQFKNLKSAIKNKKSRATLNDVGIQAANRDALIPQVDNRLLFTQSRTPWIRMLGQFLSWAMAKSASTNRMIKRVEGGDAKLLIKTLATIPIYAGIQQLREYAKYGHVTSDWDYDKEQLLAKSWQLSGMTGWLSDLIFNRFLGPGSKQQGTNYFVSFPALTMLTNIADYGLTFISGDKKKRKEILDKKILPIPGWRNLIRKKFFPKKGESSVGSSSTSPGLNKGGVIDRQSFIVGGAANAIKKLAYNYVKQNINPAKTQVTNTKETYKKVNKILQDLNKNKIHDFGSGLGLGTKELKGIVTSHEPYTVMERIVKLKGTVPNYRTSAETILKEGVKSKDGVVNLNVLNVIQSKKDRKKVVEDIGKLLSDDGVAVITTQSKKAVDNLANKSKNATQFKDGWLMGPAKKERTFQKGFEQKELEKYIKEILGNKISIEKIPPKYGIKTTGVIIKKGKNNLSDLKNQVIKIDSSIKRNSSTGVGKKIGGELYVHKSSEDVIPNLISFKSKLPSNYKYDVVKYNDKDKIVSFIKVPEFNIVQEPLATTGLKVFSDGTIKNININQIYHHKWLFVDDSYKGFNVVDSIKRSLAWLPLRKNKAKSLKDFKWASIGRQEAWNKVIPFIPKLSIGGQVARLGLSSGDVIVPPMKPRFQTEEEASQGNPGNKESGLLFPVEENKNMNKKDMAAILAAGSIAAAGINFDMDKAAKNKILPEKKPDVVVKKNYDKIPDLDPDKKEWLFNTAEKVYKINKDKVIPSDIILAINGGETGWGTSRFWNEGSNNLFNFQSFDDNEESIDALNSNAKIK